MSATLPGAGEPAGAPNAARRTGFTFVELMVAMALMMILTGSVVFIFMQAQEIFLSVDARVQVYQYARYAFDQMERDLANVVRTQDMEFFNDQPANAMGTPQHYDPLEEIPIRGTDNRIGDPINGDQTYNRAFTIRQPEPYEDEKARKHRRDSIYFKTVTIIEGKTQSALVEYALVDHDKIRPRMVKRLWSVTGVDNSNLLAPRLQINGNDQAMPIEQDLCLYAVDTKFEVFVKNRRRNDPGAYYEARLLTAPPQSPRAGEGKVFEALPNSSGWVAPNYMVQTYYDQTWTGGMMPDLGVLKPGTDSLPVLLSTGNDFTFPMLREGDKIFLRDARNPQPKIKAQEYTIKGFVEGGTDPAAPWKPNLPRQKFRIQFEEKIDISQDVEVSYMAAWVPSALRVTLRIKDAKSRELRTVGRVFKIFTN